MIKKKVSVHIISDRCVTIAEGGEPPFADATDEDVSRDSESEHIEEFSEGYLTVIGDTVTLIYNGSAENFMDSTRTKLTFDKTNPQLVTIIRTGELTSSLTFQPHTRNICTYTLPFGQFELAVSSKEVDNRLLEDGIVLLDYIVEIHGTTAEKTRLTLTVKDSVREV